MLKKLPLLIVVALLSFIQPAHAEIIFAPAITYMQQNQEVPPAAETDAKLTVIDLRLGYVFDFGLYLGGLYSIQDHDMLSDSSDSYMGPSVGYYNSGFLVVGTYYIYGEKDQSTGNTKLSGISGYQLDVSYTLPLTKSLRMGPQLSYHAYEFDEAEVGGFASDTEFKFSSVTPYFNFIFVF